LEFLLYPQLIRYTCNCNRFAPPLRDYRSFTLAMGSSPGFGSTQCNLFALFRLAFAPAPQVPLLSLATQSKSPAHSSIGTPSLRRIRAPTACRHAVSDLFHSPPGVLFTFPSRYWFTIGHHGYLALESGLPRFPRDFSCPAVLKVFGRRHLLFWLRVSHPLWRSVPGTFA
jgi:hypothetical protein